MALLSDSWEIVDMVVGFLERKKGPLGLAYVGKYGESLIPEYPAVVVIPIQREKVLHGEGTFNLNIELDLYVYHADLTLDKRQRSKADMQLVARIEAELEKDYGWKADEANPLDDRQIIFGYVSGEEFGVLQPRSTKSNSVICTRMTWRALTQRRLK
jgi:hypothetical protein